MTPAIRCRCGTDVGAVSMSSAGAQRRPCWFPSCEEGAECCANFLSNVNRARAEQIRVGEAQHPEALTYKPTVTFAIMLKRTRIIVVLAPIRFNHDAAFHHEVHAPYSVNETLWMHGQPSLGQAHACQGLKRRLGTGIGVGDEPLSARSCQASTGAV